MPDVTRYDLVLARRAIGLGALLALVALVIVAATDEPGSTFAGRLGRLAALMPIAGGVGAALVGSQARARGESAALQAIGVAPWSAVRGASLGGATVGAIGAAVALARSVDLGPLFPRVAHGAAFRAAGEGFVDAARGLVVLPSGAMLRRAGEGVVSAPEGSPRLATALALLVAAVAVPVWSAAPARAGRRLAVALAASMAAVAAFHLVGAGRAPAIVLVVPPLLLALDARRIYVHTARA